MVFKKGQAALDFLMTYGWAIALVVIIAAVLFAMGVFDTSNFIGNKAAGFAGCAVKGWNFNTNGDLTLKFSNQVGQRINVTGVTATIGGITGSNSTTETIAPGADSSTYSISGFGTQTANTGYTAMVAINYTDLNSNFKYTSSGTLTGRVA